jgi:sugar-specific transcriptional regulator TrmB
MAYLLEPVGLGESDNKVYLAMLDTPRRTLSELADRTELPAAAVRRCLGRLIDVGLATKMLTRPPRYLAAHPEVALEALVVRRERELQELRVAASELALRLEDMPSAGPGDLVELIEGEEAVQHQLAQLQLDAREEVLIVDAPPYLQGTPVQNQEELQALRRGVTYRCVYHRPALELPGHFEQLTECIRAGEQARTLISVTMKMQIVDRKVAVIPVAFTPTETKSRLIVRASPMLDALLQCFESLWEKAIPVPSPGTDLPTGEPLSGPSTRDQLLLSLLSTGMKDRAIARTLGITERTLSRHLRDLLIALEADTRFQAGIQAARLGWLKTPDRTDCDPA